MKFNKAQIITLVTHVIVAATAAYVAKQGITLSQWTTDVKDVVGLAVTGVAWYVAHKQAKTPPAQNEKKTVTGSKP